RTRGEKLVRIEIMAVAVALGLAGCLGTTGDTSSYDAKSSALKDDTLDVNPCNNPDAVTILDAYTFIHRGGGLLRVTPWTWTSPRMAFFASPSRTVRVERLGRAAGRPISGTSVPPNPRSALTRSNGK